MTGKIDNEEEEKLKWILSPTFNSSVKKGSSYLSEKASSLKNGLFIEIGPRLNFSTAFSTNAVSICAAVDLGKKINRIERSILYLIKYEVILQLLVFINIKNFYLFIFNFSNS
jgi:phosphoribosylformylglycinamidine synthase